MNHTHSIFFSPTGTSRAVVRAVARGVNRPSETTLDLTRQEAPPARFDADHLAIVGMPVYRGRLPRTAIGRFQPLEGNRTPAVAIVVYGNWAYEDALLELCDLCTAQGFRLVGAAAFIGQHSFSSLKHPIAENRPNPQDLEQAEQLGRRVREQMEQPGLSMPELPGSRPYKEVPPDPFVSATDVDTASCTGCGRCATACPTRCIEMVGSLPQTAPDRCLWCMACVRQCPASARRIVLPKIHEAAQRLSTNCKIPQEPEIFLPSGG